MIRRFRKLDTLTQAVLIALTLTCYAFVKQCNTTLEQLPQTAQELQHQQQSTGEHFHNTLERIAEQ